MTTKTEFLRLKRLISDAEALPKIIEGMKLNNSQRVRVLHKRDNAVLGAIKLIKRNEFLSKNCVEHLKDLDGLDYGMKRELLLESLYQAEKDFLTFDPTLGNPTVRNNGKNSVEWQLIHKEIAQVSKQKFEDGYYADSVFSAFREINVRIKEFYIRKTKKESDGSDLMFKFSAQILL